MMNSHPSSPLTTPRLASIDAYRGLVMLLMMAEVLHLSHLANAFPTNGLVSFLTFHQSHVPWIGCSLHDLIQPSFSFLVGVAMMFSLRRRQTAGEHRGQTWRHALLRSLLLIWLGVFLRSVGATQPNFTFEDTLSQIGLGYFFLFLIAPLSLKKQILTLAGVLVGYWLFFVIYPAPGADFHWAEAGVPADWGHFQTGIAAHWNLNSNPAWAFDKWFMNLFPRESPFLFNEGGYSTLSFIPTLGTMILGLMAGRILQSPGGKIALLLRWAVICWVLGLVWHFVGQCPIVKRIWTPSWTLFSGGTCFALLAGFYALLDLKSKPKPPCWAFPLLVIGSNSIVAYFIAHLWPEFFRSTLQTWGNWMMTGISPEFHRLVEGFFILLCLWGCLYVLWRKKWFVRL